MSTTKKKKRNRQRYRTRSVTPVPNGGDIEDRELLSSFKLLIASLVVVILTAIGTHLINAKSREEIFQRVPLPVIVIYISALFLLTAKGTLVAVVYYFGGKTFQQLKVLFRWDFISGVFIFSAVLLQLSYLYGIPDKIFLLFRTLIPAVGEQINTSLSTIVTWALSGIIGNFAYAVLTKLVLRRRKGGGK